MFKYRKIRSKIQKVCIKCVCVLATLLQPSTTVVIKPQVTNTNAAELQPNHDQSLRTEAIPSQLFQPLTLDAQHPASHAGSENIPNANFQVLQDHAAMPLHLLPATEPIVHHHAIKPPQYFITTTRENQPSSASYDLHTLYTFHRDSNGQQVFYMDNNDAQFIKPNEHVQHFHVSTVPQSVGNHYHHDGNFAAGTPTVIHEYRIYVPHGANTF